MPKEGEGRPQFSPMPVRALRDARLTASHLRVLGVVCSHDRLSLHRKAGQGCWASNATIAKNANVHYNNVSTAIGDLLAWGYLRRESYRFDRRRHVYRVIYELLLASKGSSKNEKPSDKLRAEKKFPSKISGLRIVNIFR